MMILNIILVLVWTIVLLMIIYWLFFIYRQVGPTCGIYAAAYATNQKKAVQNMAKYAFEHEYTKIGEFFELPTMKKMVEDNSTYRAEIIDIKNLKKKLLNGPVIVPIMINCPHYVVADHIIMDKFIYVFDPAYGISRYYPLKKFLTMNSSLPETFSWDDYYLTNHWKYYKRVLGKILNKEVYTLTYNAYQSKKDKLKGQNDKVILANRALALKEIKK